MRIEICTPAIFCSFGLSSRTISWALRVRCSQGASVSTTKPEFGAHKPESRNMFVTSPLFLSGATAASICRISVSMKSTLTPCGALTEIGMKPRSSFGVSCSGSCV